jgi:hypothetical protein
MPKSLQEPDHAGCCLLRYASAERARAYSEPAELRVGSGKKLVWHTGDAGHRRLFVTVALLSAVLWLAVRLAIGLL